MSEATVDKLTPHADGKKRKMVMTKLTAIALTASGSNKHADVTFFKSKNTPKKDVNDIKKRGFLTDSFEGYSHVLSVGEHTIINGGDTTWQDGHSHPFILDDNGSIIVGMANDHTHTVEGDVSQFLKSVHPDEKDKKKRNKSLKKEDTCMSDANANQTSEIEKLQADLKKANSLATMTDAQKEFYASLDETEQVSFLDKSAETRDADMELAKKTDGVVFKSADGVEYRKSDDPRLVDLAKKLDADAIKRTSEKKEFIKERAKREEMVYTKRAEDELSHLPGDIKTHVALLKSIDGIEDKDQREAALATLKAQNAVLAPAFAPVGTTEVSKVSDDADTELERLTQEYIKKNPEKDYFDAYDIISKANPETLAKSMA